MKCPKCGYLGFETTDRCRNCQYDFSLAPFTPEVELTLHGTESQTEAASFELPEIKRQTDRLSSTALDLDRLFGTPEPKAPVEEGRRSRGFDLAIEPLQPVAPAPEPAVPSSPQLIEELPPPVVMEEPVIPDVMMAVEADVATPQPPPLVEVPESDASALPFDDAPIMPPPAARTPLAVRRSTPEVPRNRPRTTRPVRTLDFEAPAPKSSEAAREATETVASLMESPSLGVRVGAGLIDVLLLVSIDVAVLYLTLRVTGLSNSFSDLSVLPPVPLVGFLALLTFAYVAAFTVAGGQTIGKMMLSLRVIGDDGRRVDAAGGVLRALGCMLVPVTLGLSYLPALFTSDHRALHDRLAGTRVVKE